METLAGTGFSRHRAFVQETRRYRNQFITFIKEKDRRDPDSPQVYLVQEGLSSKPVAVRDIPAFIDRVSLKRAMAQVTLDAAILLALCALLFACA